jgi:hypothetical protein
MSEGLTSAHTPLADVDTRLRHATAGLQSSSYDRPREAAAHSGRSGRETAANVVPQLVQVACAEVTDVEAVGKPSPARDTS